MHIAAMVTSLSLSPMALAQSQKEFTPSGSTGDWNQLLNWTPNGVPTLSDDVLIPDGKTCTISGASNDAFCKSLEVETGATLEVQDGLTLTIRPPANHSYADLKLDGTIEISDDTETGVLRLEMTGLLTHVFEILGEGTLFGDPAEIQTDSTHTVVRIYVGPESEGYPLISGTWDIPIDVENDGTFSAGGSHIMTFDSDTCSRPGGWLPIGISGDGTFIASGGAVYMTNPVFESGFDGTLAASGEAATMVLNRCGQQGGSFDVQAANITASDDASIVFLDGLITDGASIALTSGGSLGTDLEESGAMNLANTTITIDGGTLHAEFNADFDGVELTIEGDGIAIFDRSLGAIDCQISVDEEGELHFYVNQLFLTDSSLAVAGDGSVTPPSGEDIRLDGECSVVIEDDGVLSCSVLKVGSPDEIIVTMTGGTLECDRFDLREHIVNISGGTFEVLGAEEDAGASSGIINVSGGTLKVAGGFLGTFNSDIGIYSGTLEVAASEDESDLFENRGELYFVGGTIIVREGEKAVLK
jgi:hypothetical protein